MHFWEQANKYINKQVGTAVDNRWHDTVTRAISIRDVREQVVMLCPEGTTFSSKDWLRLQFWPKTPKTKESLI